MGYESTFIVGEVAGTTYATDPGMATEEQRAFAAEVMRLKHRAGELGLFQTMQALEPATQAVGWELAELQDPAQRKLHERYREAHSRA